MRDFADDLCNRKAVCPLSAKMGRRQQASLSSSSRARRRQEAALRLPAHSSSALYDLVAKATVRLVKSSNWPSLMF
jgi:hypothetical protein